VSTDQRQAESWTRTGLLSARQRSAWCRAVGLLLAVLTTPARALDFTPCAEEGHEEFDCATLPVPVDHAGTVPGTIDLHVERLRGQAPDLPVLVALAGGPGESATSYAVDVFADELQEALNPVQLVAFDQRGTGWSGPLRCTALDDVPLDEFKQRRRWRSVRQCEEELGAAGAFYRTADSVLDLDRVRAALGAERISIFGVSYGTFVAAQYARTFPDRVDRLMLDSPEGPQGNEPLQVTAAHAAGRALEAMCRDGACAGATGDPVRDTAALVRRLARQPLSGRLRVPDDTGASEQPARTRLTGGDLLNILFAGDKEPFFRAMYPAAVAAALAGDRAPLIRLAGLLAGLGDGGPQGDVREFSPVLLSVTNCADTRFPWAGIVPPHRRRAALRAAARGIPQAAPFPFDRASLLRFPDADSCLPWSRAGLPGAVVLGALPDVPVLVLVGEQDLRTPVENGVALTEGLTRAVTVIVPNAGHAVAGYPCSREKVAQFLAGERPDDRCTGGAEKLPVQPIPVSLDELPVASGLTGVAGRTLTAVERTLSDAYLLALRLGQYGPQAEWGGLRGGKISTAGGSIGPGGSIRLERASLIRGVAVTGELTASASKIGTASVTVDGREAAPGALEFHADGTVTGRLGDQDVATISSFGRALTRLAELSRATPASRWHVPPTGW
jgi:pimeloyl-ACP methyl ester carboxylesterase